MNYERTLKNIGLNESQFSVVTALLKEANEKGFYRGQRDQLQLSTEVTNHKLRQGLLDINRMSADLYNLGE